MKKYIKNVLLATAAMSVLGVAHAQTANDVTQNRGYVGLVWTLEKSSVVPDVVLGLRHTKTNSASDVTGYDVSARFKFNGNAPFDSVRAVYLDGNRSSQANIGLGYSITHQSVLGTVGASAEHFKLGLDYLYKPAKFDAFIEVNTLEQPQKVQEVLPG